MFRLKNCYRSHNIYMKQPVYNIFTKRIRTSDNTNRGAPLFFQGIKTGILNEFVNFIMNANSIS